MAEAHVPRKWRRDFDLIQAAVAAGERCPMNHPEGPLQSGAIAALAHRGALKSEVFGRNFRRVTLLVGPHAGKSTADPPATYRRAPYKGT